MNDKLWIGALGVLFEVQHKFVPKAVEFIDEWGNGLMLPRAYTLLTHAPTREDVMEAIACLALSLVPKK